MNTLTVTIPRNLWMSSNRPIARHGQKSRKARDIQERAALAATQQQLDVQRGAVRALWTIRYPRGVGWEHGDPVNAHPTTKPILDALVDGGWLPGDGPRLVLLEAFQRGYNLTVPELHDVELRLLDPSERLDDYLGVPA